MVPGTTPGWPGVNGAGSAPATRRPSAGRRTTTPSSTGSNCLHFAAGPHKLAGLPEVIGGQLGRSGGQAKGVLSGAADTLSGAVRQDVSKTGGPRPPGPYGPAAS